MILSFDIAPFPYKHAQRRNLFRLCPYKWFEKFNKDNFSPFFHMKEACCWEFALSKKDKLFLPRCAASVSSLSPQTPSFHLVDGLSGDWAVDTVQCCHRLTQKRTTRRNQWFIEGATEAKPEITKYACSTLPRTNTWNHQAGREG